MEEHSGATDWRKVFLYPPLFFLPSQVALVVSLSQPPLSRAFAQVSVKMV